jgi:hypothetical protein
MFKTPKLIILNTLFTIAIIGLFALAGTLNPTSAPGDTMHTLEDIYCKYADCVPASFGLNSTSSVQTTMHTTRDIYEVIDTEQYGRGWLPETSGTDATTSLTQAACEAAADWEWFEDGNGDGDVIDPEDGICVMVTTVAAGLSWNGYDYTTNYDNTYIAGYTCEGSFPTGHVKAGTYNGLTSAGAADTTWNSGDCALCEADCFDGRRDLPAQGTYTSNNGNLTIGYNGPLTPEALKNWQGTRLPTFEDFFGFCGYKDAGYDYTTGCNTSTTLGRYGQMVGRTDECLDFPVAAAGTYEWLSEQVYNSNARVAGIYACSYSDYNFVYFGYRFRAVFRP